MPILRTLLLCTPTLVALVGEPHPRPFPPGLEPLDAINTAPLPKGADGRFPEELAFASKSADGIDVVHARGYVNAPLVRVWEALQRPEACVDRRHSDEWSSQPGSAGGPEVSFVVRTVVRAIITVEFDVAWRQRLVEGTAQEPEVVVGRWRKTSGTRFIEHLEGSFVLRRIDGHTTQIELIEHLTAYNTGTAEMRAFLNDLFSGVVALSHGRALPAVDELATAQ